MTLVPLSAAPLAIQIHAFAALMLIPLTVTLFRLSKGSRLHRSLGWCWVCLMALVAFSSFWVQEIRLIGGFSLIHLLSIFTLVTLAMAVGAARSHRIHQHQQAMRWLSYGALLGAGAFTLLPGRIMHAVVVGL